MDMQSSTNKELCSFMASRIRAERIRRKLTQIKMAEKAGMAVRTYKRFESSGSGTIANLIEILRALDRIRILEIFLPPPEPASPRISLVEQLQQIQQTANKAR